MKKGTKIALLVAAGLIALGAVLSGVAFLLGANILTLFTSGALHFNSHTNFHAARHWDSVYQSSGIYEAGVQEIDSLNLDWVSGTVQVQVYDGDEIRFQETSGQALEEETALRWGQEDGMLYIQYCQDGITKDLPEKDLQVQIPRALAGQLNEVIFDTTSSDLQLQDVKVETLSAFATSGSIDCTNVTADTAELGSTSGDLSFDGATAFITAGSTSGSVTVINKADGAEAFLDSTSGALLVAGTFSTLQMETTSGSMETKEAVTAGQLQADTSSGDIDLQGDFDQVDAETTSGRLSIGSLHCPDQVELDTASGDVTLAIPEDSGFTLDTDTSSGNFNCALEVRMKGSSYISGDGKAEIKIETTSGSISIAKK